MTKNVVDLKSNVDEMFINVTNIFEAALDYGVKITRNDFSFEKLNELVNSGWDTSKISKIRLSFLLRDTFLKDFSDRVEEPNFKYVDGVYLLIDYEGHGSSSVIYGKYLDSKSYYGKEFDNFIKGYIKELYNSSYSFLKNVYRGKDYYPDFGGYSYSAFLKITVYPNKDTGRGNIDLVINSEIPNSKDSFTTYERLYDYESNNFDEISIKLPEFFSLGSALEVSKPVRDCLRTINRDVCNLLKENYGVISNGIGKRKQYWGSGVIGGSFRVTSKGYVFKCIMGDLTDGGKYGERIFYGNDVDELTYYVYVGKDNGKFDVYVENETNYVGEEEFNKLKKELGIGDGNVHFIRVPQEILSKIPNLQYLVQTCFEEYLFGKVMNLGSKDNYLGALPRGIEYNIPKHEFNLNQYIQDDEVFFPIICNDYRSIVYSGSVSDKILRRKKDWYYTFADLYDYNKNGENKEEGYDENDRDIESGIYRLGKGFLFVDQYNKLEEWQFEDIFLSSEGKNSDIRTVPGVIKVLDNLENTLKIEKESLLFFVSQLDKLFMYPDLSSSIKKYFMDRREGRFSIDSLENFYITNDPSSGYSWEFILEGVNGKGDLLVRLPKGGTRGKITVNVRSRIKEFGYSTLYIPMIISLGRSLTKLVKGIFGIELKGKVSEDLKDIEGIYYKLTFKEGFESCEVVNNSDNSVIEVEIE